MRLGVGTVLPGRLKWAFVVLTQLSPHPQQLRSLNPTSPQQRHSAGGRMTFFGAPGYKPFSNHGQSKRRHHSSATKSVTSVFISCCCSYLKLGGVKQHTFVILQFWRPGVPDGSRWTEMQVVAGLCSLRRLQGRIRSSPCPAARGRPRSLACGPFLRPQSQQHGIFRLSLTLFPSSHPLPGLTCGLSW